MLYSEVMEEQLLDNIRDLLGCIYKSGSDVERCIRAIKDNAYEPFLDYKKAVANTIKAFYNLKDVNLDTKSYSLILRVLEITEIYWDFRNAITFSCDLKKNKFKNLLHTFKTNSVNPLYIFKNQLQGYGNYTLKPTLWSIRIHTSEKKKRI